MTAIILDALISFFAAFGIVCTVWCIFFQNPKKASQSFAAETAKEVELIISGDMRGGNDTAHTGKR